jgi:hypothetical protein
LIARALHRRLPERIRGAGTPYLWLRKGRTALRVARKLTAVGREHEFIDACARIPLGEGDVQLCREDLLIGGVHDDPVKALIARKLLEIGHGKGIGTIVEGIEEEAELSWVREHGADYLQGFLLGKPAPVVRS